RRKSLDWSARRIARTSRGSIGTHSAVRAGVPALVTVGVLLGILSLLLVPTGSLAGLPAMPWVSTGPPSLASRPPAPQPMVPLVSLFTRDVPALSTPAVVTLYNITFVTHPATCSIHLGLQTYFS